MKIDLFRHDLQGDLCPVRDDVGQVAVLHHLDLLAALQGHEVVLRHAQEHTALHRGGDARRAVLVDGELLGAHRHVHLAAHAGAQGLHGHAVAAAEVQGVIAAGGVQQVAQADEGGDELVGRALVDVLRRADLLDHAAVHDGDAVGDGQGLLLVVGHVDRGDADLVLDALDDVAHLHAQLGVQVGKRLVHQQHVRLDDDGAGQGDALLLAAGELGRHAVGVLVDLHHAQDFVRPAVALLPGHPAGLEAVGDVVAHGHVGEHGVVLEHHAHVALVGGDVVDHLVVHADLAAFNGVEADDHAQQRGFAAAGRAQQREKFAGLDGRRTALG